MSSLADLCFGALNPENQGSQPFHTICTDKDSLVWCAPPTTPPSIVHADLPVVIKESTLLLFRFFVFCRLRGASRTKPSCNYTLRLSISKLEISFFFFVLGSLASVLWLVNTCQVLSL